MLKTLGCQHLLEDVTVDTEDELCTKDEDIVEDADVAMKVSSGTKATYELNWNTYLTKRPSTMNWRRLERLDKD